MSTIRDGWQTQLAGDVKRDGVSLELLAPDGEVVAEVFRSDAEHTLSLETFGRAIPVGVFDVFYRQALSRLDPFEDGTTFGSLGIPEPQPPSVSAQ